MGHSGCGAAWAAASARTLARRLRRQRRAALGETRAAALAWRVELLRRSLGAHWELCDRIGAHCSSIMDAACMAELIGLPAEAAAAREIGADANWARHSPPPGGPQLVPTVPVGHAAGALEAALKLHAFPLRAGAEAFRPSAPAPQHPLSGGGRLAPGVWEVRPQVEVPLSALGEACGPSADESEVTDGGDLPAGSGHKLEGKAECKRKYGSALDEAEHGSLFEHAGGTKRLVKVC